MATLIPYTYKYKCTYNTAEHCLLSNGRLKTLFGYFSIDLNLYVLS
jgi:hypothetical protein